MVGGFNFGHFSLAGVNNTARRETLPAAAGIKSMPRIAVPSF